MERDDAADPARCDGVARLLARGHAAALTRKTAVNGAPARTSGRDSPTAAAARMTPAERERAYSPSSCIGGNYQPFIDAYVRDSEAAAQRAQALGGSWLWPSYGDAPSRQLALCLPPRAAIRASNGAPLLVFIHGGYWQELSARDSRFAAAACIERGAAFAAIDYTLAPRAGVGAIVGECRAAMRWLVAHASELAVDASRIVVAGSSAGAHLAAMVALPGGTSSAIGAANEATTEAATRPRPAAVVLVSGIFELEPLIGTSVNDALALDVVQARAQSPALAALPALTGFAPAFVAWGEIETDAFKHQSRHFADKLARAGTACTTLEVPARNHFDVVLDLADATSALGRAAFERLCGADECRSP
jgi:arylformamidase